MVIHPQSIVHSLVEYVDGSVLAQLGIPTCARRSRMRWAGLNELLGCSPRLVAAARLDFEAPDVERFPASGWRYEALGAGGTPGRVERGERGGGRGVPGRADSLHRHAPACAEALERVAGRALPARSTRRSPPTREARAVPAPG